MIVITKLNRVERYVCPGDHFCLTITDDMGCDVIIHEEITVNKVIDFIASFRFAMEDGTCPGFHLTGIFANSKELPEEMKTAKMLGDLTKDQYKNFADSVGIKIGNGAISKLKNKITNALGILGRKQA